MNPKAVTIASDQSEFFTTCLTNRYAEAGSFSGRAGAQPFDYSSVHMSRRYSIQISTGLRARRETNTETLGAQWRYCSSPDFPFGTAKEVQDLRSDPDHETSCVSLLALPVCCFIHNPTCRTDIRGYHHSSCAYHRNSHSTSSIHNHDTVYSTPHVYTEQD